MLNEDYIQTVNIALERLLVYETVFKEYGLTCHKLEIGNCLATESFSQLHDYFSRNVLRFNRFVSDCSKFKAPHGYTTFNRTFIHCLEQTQQAVSMMLMAIEDDGVNHQLYDRGVKMQEQARAQLDAAFATIDAKAI